MTPTNMSPDWIQRVISLNPCLELEGSNVRTCPVRLGFVHLDKPQPAMEAGKADKYSVTCLFQAGADIQVLKDVAMRVGVEKWGETAFMNYAKSSNFHNPFKDQGDKAQYEGFDAGNPYIVATGERKPSVVRQNMSPYEERTYSGQWAMAIVRPFAFETLNGQKVVVKRGLSFGLQSVMIIAEDTEFGGGGVDVNAAFAGVQVDTNVNPADSFGKTPGTAGADAPAAPGVFG